VLTRKQYRKATIGRQLPSTYSKILMPEAIFPYSSRQTKALLGKVSGCSVVRGNDLSDFFVLNEYCLGMKCFFTVTCIYREPFVRACTFWYRMSDCARFEVYFEYLDPLIQTVEILEIHLEYFKKETRAVWILKTFFVEVKYF